MERKAFGFLKEWKTRSTRRPLVVRGARQVGKSWLVRAFGQSEFESFVVVDFERNPDAATLFQQAAPRRTLELLEVRFGLRIEPGRTLLFLDEIQAAPDALRSLRYFHEELPGLHVIAAGSLLDITLADASLTMPVGRIEYLHLGPMQFEEYLLAAGQEKKAEFIASLPPEGEVPAAVHEDLLRHLRRFAAVGGMPEPLRVWTETGSAYESDLVKQALLSTFEDDFAKYAARVDTRRLAKVYRSLPRLAGRRFKYAHIDREERARDLAPALDLLCRARVAHRVRRTAANGAPLGAEADDRALKLLFLDVGLALRALGIDLVGLESTPDLLLVNEGAVSEQLVGQHLLYSGAPFEDPQAFFWTRDKLGSAAEVDYVVTEGAEVVPVEVKAGKTGRLKSLHLFLREKERTLGVRLNSEPPSLLEAHTALPDGRQVPFTLLSLPLYMVGQVRRLVRETLARQGA